MTARVSIDEAVSRGWIVVPDGEGRTALDEAFIEIEDGAGAEDGGEQG